MFKPLQEFANKPEPFSKYTTDELWTRPHLAEQMLKYHLDQGNDAASRTKDTIVDIVQWLDDQLSLQGKALCDLGCGPGLYAKQFAEKGAQVTGVDFSQHSLNYAEKAAEKNGDSITYLKADYVADELPTGFDIVTLIYFDFCTMSKQKRKRLLSRIHSMLNPGGVFALDVASVGAFDAKEEQLTIEQNYMNGFWGPEDYVCLHRTVLYPDSRVSLDHYLVVEPESQWQIYNWLQHYTTAGITRELEEAGFGVETLAGSLAGEALSQDSTAIAAIAKKAD